MRLWAILCGATQDEWVVVESSDKMRSTGERNGKPLLYCFLESPMSSMKRQKRYATHALACANAFLSSQPSHTLSPPLLTTCTILLLSGLPSLPSLTLRSLLSVTHQLLLPSSLPPTVFCTSYQFNSLLPSAVQPLNWTPKYLVPTDYGVWYFKNLLLILQTVSREVSSQGFISLGVIAGTH